MKEMLEVIVKNLVDNKDAVEVNEINEENHIKYEVKVAKEDMGRVIGRQGRLAKSIRTVIKSAAAKDKKRVVVDFVE